MTTVLRVCEAGQTRTNSRKVLEGGRWISSRTYSRRFDVYMSDQLGTPSQAEAATGVLLGAGYAVALTGEADAAARCTGINSDRKDDPKLFRVVATYSTEYQDAQDPFAQHFSYTTVDRQVAFEEDIDGEAVVNSSLEKFETPPTTEVSDYEITVKRFNALGSISSKTILEYNNSVNDGALSWDGESWDALQVQFKGISIERAELEGVEYLDTTYRFLARGMEDMQAGQSPHDDFILDYGFQDIFGGTADFIDPETNQRIGKLLKDGGVKPDPDPPQYLHFPKRKRKDFSVFPFV